LLSCRNEHTNEKTKTESLLRSMGGRKMARDEEDAYGKSLSGEMQPGFCVSSE
jgi:hypothetical protein